MLTTNFASPDREAPDDGWSPAGRELMGSSSAASTKHATSTNRAGHSPASAKFNANAETVRRVLRNATTRSDLSAAEREASPEP